MAQDRNSYCDFVRVLHFILMQPLCCGPGMFCNCFRWSDCDPFQQGMKQWLESVNKELDDKGAYIKILCFAETGNGGGHWQEGSLATLVIATTPGQVERLKAEPVLQQGHSGDANWACWCCPAHEGRVV
jgi:hypothetical protein